MRYALIGCGRIAVNHVKAAFNNHLEFIAACDVDVRNIGLLFDKCGVNPYSSKAISIYDDYKKMILDNKPELAAIATESGAHAEIALYCIDHGIHCIIEKPMAMSIQDAEDIVTRSEERGVKVAVCHQNRFNLAVQKVKAALEAERFGQLSHGSIHVRWNRNKDYYDQAPWRGKWAYDGGALMNQCIHGIDLLRWLLGDEIDTVYGQTRQRVHPYLEAEDVGLGVISFKNGTIATVEGTTNVYPSNLSEDLYILGEYGTVKLGGQSANHIEVWNFSDEAADDHEAMGLKEATSDVYGNGHLRLYADMIKAIQEDSKPYIDAAAGRNAVETVLAIYKSQLTGMPVQLPLKSFSSTDMFGTFK